MKKKQITERVIHGCFLILGLITVGCVLLITVYLVISGIPAIRKIGLAEFLFGTQWASTAAEPKFGILPFLLTSIYGTAGAIVLGVPVGFMTAVYLSGFASPRVKSLMQTAVSLLAGIPSVVYGLVGMKVLIPGIRRRSGGYAPVLQSHGFLPAGGQPDAGHHESAHHNAHHAGESENRPPILPRGSIWIGRRKVAGRPDCCTASELHGI